MPYLVSVARQDPDLGAGAGVPDPAGLIAARRPDRAGIGERGAGVDRSDMTRQRSSLLAGRQLDQADCPVVPGGDSKPVVRGDCAALDGGGRFVPGGGARLSGLHVPQDTGALSSPPDTTADAPNVHQCG
jgi:hypothetical protein